MDVNAFISDSASDNYATYELLKRWDIKAIIALNPTNDGNRKYPAHLSINDKGIPLCPGGNKMVYWGVCDPKKPRLKWRCPRVLNKCEPCDSCSNCSPSPYGRVIYIKPDWDLRLFTTIPRGTKAFKEKMKERTASERINNRILHHYGLENSKMRGKKRISFFATIAAFNIHLDAQLAKLKSMGTFRFRDIFDIRAIA